MIQLDNHFNNLVTVSILWVFPISKLFQCKNADYSFWRDFDLSTMLLAMTVRYVV